MMCTACGSSQLFKIDKDFLLETYDLCGGVKMTADYYVCLECQHIEMYANKGGDLWVKISRDFASKKAKEDALENAARELRITKERIILLNKKIEDLNLKVTKLNEVINNENLTVKEHKQAISELEKTKNEIKVTDREIKEYQLFIEVGYQDKVRTINQKH